MPSPNGLRGSVFALGACASVLVSGCKRPGTIADALTTAPTLAEATGQARCGVRSSVSKPLVVEWPAAERAALEARASRGLVAVHYSGCTMEVLTTCTVSGQYEYLGLTQKREGVRIRSADELYAQLPVGAVSLEAKLERAGQLDVEMVIVGRREASESTFDEDDLDGRCDDATHVITGLTVGAFALYSGASAEVGAGVTMARAGAGARSSADRELLESDGDEGSCALASSMDITPPEGCSALLRVEVVAIDHAVGVTTAAGATPPSPDADLDRESRHAKTLTITGGVAVLGGYLGALTGGLLYGSATETLEGEQGATVVSPDRGKNITRARVSLGVLFAGLGVGTVGIGLLVWGARRGANLRARRLSQARLQPLLGPGVAGVGVSGRF